MTEATANRVVVAARDWIGTPYLHQASCKGAGADCLGLVRGVWREVVGPEAETVPPYTPDWGEIRRDENLWEAARRHLVEKQVTDCLPGDVLLFRMRSGRIAKHVGILAEPFPGPTFIHAYSGHSVLESALTDAWSDRLVACFSFPRGAD